MGKLEADIIHSEFCISRRLSFLEKWKKSHKIKKSIDFWLELDNYTVFTQSGRPPTPQFFSLGFTIDIACDFVPATS